MKTIRHSCFETNSSSTHTLAILPKSAVNIPIGQNIELKFTKKNGWDYVMDTNWKLLRVFNTNPTLTLKYLKELDIKVTISLEDLEGIMSELSWNIFDFDFDTLDMFISYIWGESKSDSFDNNYSDKIEEFSKNYKEKGYIVQSFNS